MMIIDLLAIYPTRNACVWCCGSRGSPAVSLFVRPELEVVGFPQAVKM